MPSGTVKFFNAAKGFGFITSDEDAKDIFVPAASVTAAGIASLKPGQRVDFAVTPDKKGPKAVDLKIIAPAPAPKAPRPAPVAVTPMGVPQQPMIYLDPDDDAADEALDELRRAGHEPVIIDYIASPPTADELKRLSMLLREGDQSLVRKYDALFRELRLDDRFIGDSEYWGAVFEHPHLINGPVVTDGLRAAVCRTGGAVKAFLSGDPVVAKRKGLPPNLLRLIGGETKPVMEDAPVKKPAAKPAAVPVKIKPAPKPVEKSKAKAPVKAKPPLKAAGQAAKKPTAKTKKR